MASSTDEPYALRGRSPSPGVSPTPAVGAVPELTRCLSTASSLSHGSATTDGSHFRESLGSDVSTFSRQSSGSFAPPPLRRPDLPAKDPRDRFSAMSVADRQALKRRGYMRPHGTDFAASARSRESVLNLGSIAHLQYYFARTGLLDGKGGQLARKRQQKAHTLDLSQLDPAAFLSPPPPGTSDVDSSYASMGNSPVLAAQAFVESPTLEQHPASAHDDDDWFVDDLDEPDMLPPTASTYLHREKPVPRPPSIAELKADLQAALNTASRALEEAATATEPAGYSPAPALAVPGGSASPASPGWYQVQGMHILDVMTLAIRAAKVYYTSHEQPDRLDAIKPEKEVRADLLGAMDVLKRVATRNFDGGLRPDEAAALAAWIAAARAMLRAEDEAEAADRRERAAWTWLRDDDWTDPARRVEREWCFLQSMLDGDGDDAPSPTTTAAAAAAGPLPPWTPIDRTRPPAPGALPTPFLRHLQSGVRLVQLHNCAVRKSRRRFGAIPVFHADTGKPYRAADNLRYWVKAAELRWEVLLKVDALAVVCDAGPEAWLDFEDAVLRWCRTVREEMAGELAA